MDPTLASGSPSPTAWERGLGGEGLPGLVQRTLHRAARLWLVLPGAAPTSEDDRHAAGILAAAAGHAPVTVILDGAADAHALACYPLARAALAGRKHRVWAVDLHALRDRYLAGSISPGEAAGVARWLAGEDEADPPTVAAPGLSLPAAEGVRAPTGPPARREGGERAR